MDGSAGWSSPLSPRFSQRSRCGSAPHFLALLRRLAEVPRRRTSPRRSLSRKALPQIRSRPLRRVDIDVDPPVELLGAAGGGADPEVQLRRAVEELGEGAHRGGDHRRPGLVVLEAGGLPPRDHPQLERRGGRPGTDQRRLLVDRDQPLLAPNLLDEDVAEQPAPRGPFAVGADPLALAGDRGGNERQRVELRVSVLERGAGTAALVDDQLQVGGLGVSSHPLPPGGDRGGELLLVKVRHRGQVLGGVDQHLVRTLGRARGEEVGFAGPFGGQQGIARAGEGARLGAGRLSVLLVRKSAPERGIEVGNHPRGPPGAVGLAAPRARRVELGRGAVLAALAEGAVLWSLRLARARREAVRAGGPAGGEDRPQPRQLVDADLRCAQEREGGRSPTSGSSAAGGSGGGGGGGGGAAGRGARSVPAARAAEPLPKKGSSPSIGSGKTTVVFWLEPISSSVCR